MAKVTYGSVISALSGSVGGNTYSRNRYGPYMRRRAIPVNPNTPLQSANRTNFALLSNNWQNVLTDAQRATWKTYADNVPMVPSSGGLPVQLTASSMYMRCNMPRLTAGLALVAEGPSVFTLCQLTDPVITLSGDTGPTSSVEVAFTTTDEWNILDGGALLVFVSSQQAPTINYYKGSYQFLGAALGETTAPHGVSPFNEDTGRQCIVGNKQFFRFIAVAADGRISTTIRVGGIAT